MGTTIDVNFVNGTWRSGSAPFDERRAYCSGCSKHVSVCTTQNSPHYFFEVASTFMLPKTGFFWHETSARRCRHWHRIRDKILVIFLA